MSADAAARLSEVKTRIAEAARRADRQVEDVALVAVSKTFDAEEIRPVIAAGQRLFGENRVQEAHGKWPKLREDYSGLQLHLIGPLQTNKVKDAIALFDVIETLDREKLARAFVKEGEKGAALPEFFIQINTGEEPQKAGILPKEADAFIALCRDEFGLPVTGLMCIPPVEEEPSLHFALLKKIAERNGLAKLSMGMSADYEVAVTFGATHVRVGSAIFGERTSVNR